MEFSSTPALAHTAILVWGLGLLCLYLLLAVESGGILPLPE